MIKVSVIEKETLLKEYKTKEDANCISICGERCRLLEAAYVSIDSIPNQIHLSDVREDGFPNVFGATIYQAKNFKTRGVFYLLLDSSLVKQVDVPQIKDWLPGLLEEEMPGRWFMFENKLYLHYPEITIHNSMGMSHTIEDLVVQISITENRGLDMSEQLSGHRLSFTVEEIQKGFGHPHLDRSYGPGSGIFCLGSSPFRKLIHDVRKGITPQQFKLFLAQLEAYLSWESLDGVPYISMQVLGSLRQPSINDLYYPEQITISMRHLMSDFWFNRLEAEDLMFSDGHHIYSPGLNEEKSIKIEKELVDYIIDLSGTDDLFGQYGLLVKYDLNLSHYYEVEEDLPQNGNVNLPATQLPSEVIEALNIERRIIPKKNKDIVERKFMYRLHPYILSDIIIDINNLLINTQDELHRDSVEVQTSSVDNRRVGLADSTATPSVSGWG